VLHLWWEVAVVAVVEKKLRKFRLPGLGNKEHAAPSNPTDDVVHRSVEFVADAIFPDEGSEKHAWHCQ
jgi:hypothetical protein